MAWVKTGTVTVENGSPLVVGSGTGWNNLVESGDVFCVVDVNGLPTGGLYEVDRLVRDPEDAYYSVPLGSTNPEVRLVLAQNYQGSSGGGKAYALLNVTGELTTPRFAGRLQRFLELERWNVQQVNNLLLAADAEALAALAQAVSDNADATSGYRADALGAKSLAEGARDAAVVAKNASESARDAAQSARDTTEGYRTTTLGYRNDAGASATNAASSQTMAAKWAAHPEDTVVDAGKYSALHYAAKAEDSATSANTAATEATAAANLAFGATAPAWDPLGTYDYPDVVAGSDGATYRCTGTGITTDPTTDQSNWKALVLVVLSTFEDDMLGDLMPVESPVESYGWEIDGNGDIMPAA